MRGVTRDRSYHEGRLERRGVQARRHRRHRDGRRRRLPGLHPRPGHRRRERGRRRRVRRGRQDRHQRRRRGGGPHPAQDAQAGVPRGEQDGHAEPDRRAVGVLPAGPGGSVAGVGHARARHGRLARRGGRRASQGGPRRGRRGGRRRQRGHHRPSERGQELAHEPAHRERALHRLGRGRHPRATPSTRASSATGGATPSWTPRDFAARARSTRTWSTTASCAPCAPSTAPTWRCSSSTPRSASPTKTSASPVRGRARLRHGRRAQQVGPRRRPRGEGRDRERIADRLTFVGYAPVIAISALTGKKGRARLGRHRRRVRELLPDHPHEQAEHLAGARSGRRGTRCRAARPSCA